MSYIYVKLHFRIISYHELQPNMLWVVSHRLEFGSLWRVWPDPARRPRVCPGCSQVPCSGGCSQEPCSGGASVLWEREAAPRAVVRELGRATVATAFGTGIGPRRENPASYERESAVKNDSNSLPGR